MTKVMRVAAFVVAVLLPLTASGQSGATLTTDKTGYLAGETITISGAGFGADEPVAVKVAHTGPGAAGASDPAPWEVWADAQGAFETSWLIDPSDSPGTQFTVAAAGQTSGSSAQAAFARIAVIETDKLDYQPGEIGQISGRGFLPHELVVVDVTHVNGLVGGYGHEPFTVGADASGQITAPWFVDPVDSEGGIFLATATGSDSGLRALTIFTDSIVIIVDDAGPDDYPGQKDLNKLTIDDGNLPTALAVSWNWDDTAWSGNNTGDGCSLFDTNGNGLANYALCVSVGGSPAVFKTTTLYACSDANADRCANSAPASFSGSCNAGVVAASDPFGAIPSHTTGNQCGDSPACYTADTVAACTVQLANLGATTARLINVCSYPSAQPNSAPSECVVTPNNGFLTIVKVDNESGDSTAFTFNLGAGQASQGGTSSWTINGSGSVSSISFAPGTSYDLSEAVPSGWNLDSASCNINGTGTGTPTSTGVDNFAIQSGLETVCTFTDSKKKGSLKISKTLSNPDGASVPTSFTINYDCGGTYAGSVSVAAGGSQTVSGIPTGSSCTVSEPALTPIAGYTWGTAVVTGSPATIGYNTTVEVSVANSITLDRGSLKISKTLSNPDGASVPANFTINYNCGTSYIGSVSVTAGSFQTVGGIPTGNTCSVVETAPAPISGYTWGPITYTPTTIVISTKGGTFEIVVGNSITRDRGSLTIVKRVINDNGGTATVSAFGLATSAGSLTFDSGVANGTTTTYTSQAITVVTANYSLYENDVYGYTEGTWSCTNGTASPTTYNSGSVYVGKDMNVVCTITNNDDPGRIVIIKNAKPAQGSFAFTTTGAGYNSFTLTGATTNSGNVNTQTLNAGTYTVKEGTQLAWYLTGIGGSSDPNTPYNCVVIGSGGSTGVGDLNTMTTTVNLKNGDTVTCTFENTGAGATRTQGFWATHPQLAQIAWFGGTAFGHTFPGVAGTSGIGNRTLCSKTIEGPGLNSPGDISKLMGGFWSDISKKSTGTKRTALDQARMQLLQQLLSAELNASAFGSVPVGGSTMFASWESSYCGTDTKKMQTALQQAATFNTAGDSSTFTPGTSADSKYARSVADIKFWDTLP